MTFDPIVGAMLLATGRGRGMARFGNSAQAFLASLAPLLAFPLVGAGLLLLAGSGVGAIRVLLVTAIAQLAPPVASHLVAARWGKEAGWLRYATAFNWCQWMIPLAGFVILLVLQVASGGTLGEEEAAELLVLGLGLYGIWLHWMIARHGLELGRGRAALLVIAVNAFTAVLIITPRLFSSAAS